MFADPPEKKCLSVVGNQKNKKLEFVLVLSMTNTRKMIVNIYHVHISITAMLFF